MAIAHIRQADQAIQTVREHLLGVQKLAERFGSKLGLKHVAGMAGLLHDLGKYSPQFQTYIWDAVHHPEQAQRRGSVDHSTAGGKLLFDRYHVNRSKPNAQYLFLLAEVAGNSIISHHSYLRDFLNPKLESEYLQRVREKDAELLQYEQACQLFFHKVMSERELDQYAEQAALELERYLSRDTGDSLENKLLFLSKFVFSVLIDADRTNTMEFEENITESMIEDFGLRTELFKDYFSKLHDKLKTFKENPGTNCLVNQLREEMSENCENFAINPSNIYTLSIPTGGGKTLASFRYALKHAIEFNKKKIIYIVPFTTIIEQNAQEIRNIILDEGHLLEHHSNVIQDDEDDEQFDGWGGISQKLKLAKDNWNSPIIFTTMVQFLNVFYSKGSRNIRRLHQLSESILIFDEVQKVPTSCVSLFNWSLNFLKNFASCSIVLCTATQPALDFVENKLHLEKDTEMVKESTMVSDAFKRVEIIDQAITEKFDTGRLACFVEEKIALVQSVLVILNTKTVVSKLYELLKDMEVAVYHLSTSMCPAHRKDVLHQVREHLKNGERVICISTQLIEAGVDVSFQCVIRSLAGVDSIAQAAGRCNRHGELGIQPVYIIDHLEEKLDRLPEIKIGKEITRKILIDLQKDPTLHGGSLLAEEAITWYFERFYKELERNLNYPIKQLRKDMTSLLAGHKHEQDSYYTQYLAEYKQGLPIFLTNSLRTAADHFEVIETITDSVIVPYEERGKAIIAELNGEQTVSDLSRLLKQAQQYSVNLFRYEKDLLMQNNGLIPLMEGKIWALAETAYSKESGVCVDNDGEADFLGY